MAAIKKIKEANIGYEFKPAQVLIPGESQKVSFTGASAQSSAINSIVVQLTATEDCFILIGSNPTAVTDYSNNSFFMLAGVQTFGINYGDKIAVISNGTNGDLHILAAEVAE